MEARSSSLAKGEATEREANSRSGGQRPITSGAVSPHARHRRARRRDVCGKPFRRRENGSAFEKPAGRGRSPEPGAGARPFSPRNVSERPPHGGPQTPNVGHTFCPETRIIIFRWCSKNMYVKKCTQIIMV